MNGEGLAAFIKKNPIGVTCAFLSVTVVAMIYARHGEVPDAENVLLQRTKEADRYSLNIKNAAQLKEHYEILASASKEVDARLVRASQLGVNNQFFFKLESETGSKLIDFRQNGVAAKKDAKAQFLPISFSVSVQGEMSHLIRFLRLLERGPHYTRIVTATWMQSGRDPQRGGLILTLNLETLGLP